MKNCTFWEWLKAAGIRAIKTFAQVAVSLLTVGQAFYEVNWVNVLSISVTAAIISLLTSVAGLPELEHDKPGEKGAHEITD